MKKSILTLVIILMAIFVSGQTEVEPDNNHYQTADEHSITVCAKIETVALPCVS